MSSEALTLKVLPLQSVFAAPPIGLDPVNSYAPIRKVACLDSPPSSRIKRLAVAGKPLGRCCIGNSKNP